MIFKAIKWNLARAKWALLLSTISIVGLTFNTDAANSDSAKVDEVNAQQFSGINQVTFNQAEYNNTFAGNAFLINYKNKVYAVTVKHALMVAKTPSLKSVYLEDELKEWRIHPNKNNHQYITLGKLLNADKNELIDDKILTKDWLVFEVKENKSNLAVLALRDTPLEVGELLTAYGCTYETQETCSQNKYSGTFIEVEYHNIRVAPFEETSIAGLSGSPVLDKQNKLVGIVSTTRESKSGDGFDYTHASLDYLLAVLNKLPH
jgi:hypothetical protein